MSLTSFQAMRLPSAVWTIGSYLWVEAFVKNPPNPWSREEEKTVWCEILQMFWHGAVPAAFASSHSFLDLSESCRNECRSCWPVPRSQHWYLCHDGHRFVLRTSCLWPGHFVPSSSMVWRCCLGLWHVWSQSCLGAVLLANVLCRWSPLRLALSNACLSIGSLQEFCSPLVCRRSWGLTWGNGLPEGNRSCVSGAAAQCFL